VEPYRKRLARDLDDWIARGWVSPENRTRILNSVPETGPRWSAGGAAAILGAVLVTLGVLSFVAANWADLAPAWRFALILVFIWGGFGGAGWAFRAGRPALGHALVLIAAGLFGAGIMLTAQTFNMAAFRNTAVLIWAAGALAAALFTPSRPTLILAALLGLLWLGLETANSFAPDVLWSYAPLWLVTFAAANRMRSIVTANIAAAGAAFWGMSALQALSDAGRVSQLEAGALFILGAAAIALIAAALRDREVFTAGVAANWGAAIAVAGGFILQLPLARYGNVAERPGDAERLQETWMTAVGDPGGAYFLPALVAFLAVLSVGVFRGLTGKMSWLTVLAVTAAALAAGALPGLVQSIGPDHVLALRIGIGAVLYALAGGLIAHGARSGRRFAAGVGVVLFVAHSLHVYAVLFGDLLRTSAFFIVGGLLFIALSLAADQLRRRADRRPAPIEGAAE